MNDYQNNYLSEAVRQKIKLFTKESYFKCFNYILSEKSRNLPAFKKYSNISFSNELLLKEKENSRNKLQLIKLEKEKTNQSLWQLIMLLITDIPNKKKLEYKTNEFNLNPICYYYITNLCNKKLKLLSSFSIIHKIPLDILVKFYLDLCINQINQKEADSFTNNNSLEKSIKIIDFKKFSKKSSQPVSLKKQNMQKINNNNIREKKQPILVSPPVEYSNSFTRLFIGEIDPSSVRERYLSNIVVKKLKQLHLYNSYQELSNMYLKRLYNKLFKKDSKGIVDSDMAEILSKFKYDTKKVEIYQRNALSFDNKKNIRDNYIDEEKQNLEKQLERQRHLYMEPKIGKQNKLKKRKNNKLLSLSPNIIRNDIRIKFKLRRNNDINMRYKNNSVIISNNSKYHNVSDYWVSNEIRSMSAKHSRDKYKKELSNKIQISNSNKNKYKIIYSLFNPDSKNKNKNNIAKRSNSILMKMKRRYEENNIGFIKKKKFNLKNFLKNDDFYFSKMN